MLRRRAKKPMSAQPAKPQKTVAAKRTESGRPAVVEKGAFDLLELVRLTVECRRKGLFTGEEALEKIESLLA